MEIKELQQKANYIRQQVVKLIYTAGCGHIGGDLSETDVLVALYYKYLHCSPELVDDPNRDRYIQSKGHCVEALYCVLADRGFIAEEDLATYSQFGSQYIGHPNNKINGIEMNSGSLGHGLALGVGMALAAKMDEKSYKTFVLMGDGELAEGSVWEAAMAASHYKLDNLVGIVDRNGLQISGTTEEVMAHGDVGERFRAFGWHVIDIADGNDMEQICAALDEAVAFTAGPTMLIAHTTKGKGCGSIENQAVWHHKVPTAEQYEAMQAELKAGEQNG